MDFEQKAEILFEQGKYKKAIEFYKKELSVNPNSVLPKVCIAHSYILLKKHSLALEILHDVLSIEPELWYLHYVFSICYLEMESLSKGLEHAERCLTINPENSYSYYILGELEYFKRDFQKAHESASKGLEFNPNDDALLNLKSRALLHLGEISSANHVADENLMQNPEEQSSHSLKGVIELENGNPKAAEHHFKIALSINPNSEIDEEGLIECLKANSMFYKFFLRRAFGKYHFQEKIGFWSVFKILIGIKFLPIIIGVVIFYLLVCWYFSVLYESILFLRKGYRNLLGRNKQLRAKCFLVITGTTVISGVLASHFKSSWMWLAFWFQAIGIFFFISFFESERRVGAITSLLFSSFSILIFITPLLYNGIENLVWSVIWGVFMLGIYGLVFSLNGIK